MVEHEGGYFQDALSWVTRGRQHALGLGEQVRVRECTIRVLELTADGRPMRVEFAFDRPLENERYDFRVAVGDGRFAAFELPRAGARVRLAAL